MDLEIRWSPEAIEDLESITEYIARDSGFYANAVATEILSRARKIIDFPRAGRVVPELNQEDIREVFVYSYRLIYKIKSTHILIVAVIHGKRLLGGLSDRL